MDDASSWVRRFAKLAPAGEVLDLACGHGRHTRLFAQAGHAVLALDRDAHALQQAQGAGVTVMLHDLEAGGYAWPEALSAGRFSAIVVTNYLHRPLMDALFASLAPGGVLIYETFAQGNEQFGRPSNPDFLLRQGELLDLAARSGLRVVAYECGVTSGTGPAPKVAMVQRLCAVGPLFVSTAAVLDQSEARF
jgi:SAM-dependent methyltransferase